MTTELQGKVGLITGGTSGIGRDTAVLFAKAGAKVVVAGRREVEGQETIDLVRAAGGDAFFVKADVSQASAAHYRVTSRRCGCISRAAVCPAVDPSMDAPPQSGLQRC